MEEHNLKITVYGAEEKCASCIHLPSAKETMEWLEAAVLRKFPELDFQFEYIDIDVPGEKEVHIKYAELIKADEFFYPLVVLGNEVIAEGNPNLKEVFKKIEHASNE
ncbi:DUF1462 family protein [Halalkalibacter krulwichiae]|uniref:Disulfide oxidoreductase YuzD n=1 Tax=Halalkalibacter krulwichiae TaxID=199441 RepID=A0A1X9MHD5_9BACI|nr:DUF1462 family protein [Halalkalibacter krulwichiae]ARK31920.1 hypothetical protein BkAM31D_19885 [Halalkalibacter krulwichiae]